MNSKGYIHSTESFGSVDGPGIRFLIFLQGCQMRCRYCHNPDTWRLGSDACGTTATVDELLNKAERYRSYWGPDGGITVSGGEALLQIDFLIELFEEAHPASTPVSTRLLSLLLARSHSLVSSSA